VLVIAASFTGRTHLVGREIARMLDAKYLRLFEMPPLKELTEIMGQSAPVSPRDAVDLATAVAALSSPDVEVAFIGSPIWGTIAPKLDKLVEQSGIEGKLIVPFCTHMQQFNRKILDDFAERIKARKARVAAPIVVRLPLFFTEQDILSEIWRLLPQRADLWWNREKGIVPRCAVGNPGRPGVVQCAVNGGVAWVWEPYNVDPGTTIHMQRPMLRAAGAFEMDKTEVTKKEYDQSVKEGRSRPLKIWNGTCSNITQGKGDVPMPCVSFKEAADWCAARGMRLPTLVEWVRAARGDSSNPFPWGMRLEFDGTLGNFGDSVTTGRPESACPGNSGNFVFDGYAGVAPVCSFPRGNSPFGLCDMAGNLSEWVVMPVVEGREQPVLAGGTWFSCSPEAQSINKTRVFPAFMAFDGTGFRCAK
jgi:hypothetical protein